MRSDYDLVGDFHQKFDLDNTTHRGTGPRRVDPLLLAFRLKFLAEELSEYDRAADAKDLPLMADALVDLVYVALGTAQLLGLPWDDLFNEVHRANMRKVRATKAEDSARGSTYDVVKPEGWRPPDVKSVLKRYGFDV